MNSTKDLLITFSKGMFKRFPIICYYPEKACRALRQHSVSLLPFFGASQNDDLVIGFMVPISRSFITTLVQK